MDLPVEIVHQSDEKRQNGPHQLHFETDNNNPIATSLKLSDIPEVPKGKKRQFVDRRTRRRDYSDKGD